MKILFVGFAYACFLDADSFYVTSDPNIMQFYSYAANHRCVFQCFVCQIDQIFDLDDHIIYDRDSFKVDSYQR